MRTLNYGSRQAPKVDPVAEALEGYSEAAAARIRAIMERDGCTVQAAKRKYLLDPMEQHTRPKPTPSASRPDTVSYYLAAQIIGEPECVVPSLVRNGELPGYTLAGQPVVKRADCEAWLARKRALALGNPATGRR